MRRRNEGSRWPLKAPDPAIGGFSKLRQLTAEAPPRLAFSQVASQGPHSRRGHSQRAQPVMPQRVRPREVT